MGGMDPDAPYWLVITASAAGGGLLTLLGTVTTKWVDLRHRHDDERRSRYLTVLDSFDALQQALINAVNAHNARAFTDPPDMTPEIRTAMATARQRATELGTIASERFEDARRAYLAVSLFAPWRVMVALSAVFDVLQGQYLTLQRTLTTEPNPAPLHAPEWPDREWLDFRQQVRRDLGVRQGWGHRLRRIVIPRLDPDRRPAA